MEFYINQNATLPLLKLEAINNGKNSVEPLMEMIEKSTIFFSMKNQSTGEYKILNSSAGFVEKTFIEPNAKVEYYLYYKFSQSDTSESGKYEGEFMLRSDDGTMILPITEKLFININKSSILT